MDRQLLLDTMSNLRALTLAALEGLDDGPLRAIPHGYRNNILWNAGHVACSQAGLLYGPCGLPLPLPQHFTELLATGTSPLDWKRPLDTAEVLEVLRTLCGRIAEDDRAGRFATYRAWALGPGLPLRTFDEAAVFHCYHEGVHLGIISGLKKRVASA